MIDRRVEIKVGDKTYHLVPTLDAMIKINRASGSCFEAAARVRTADFEVICGVVAAGAGLSQKQAEALKSEVFQFGVINLVANALEYLGLLLEPTESKEESDSGKE